MNKPDKAATAFRPVIDCTIQSPDWRLRLPRARSLALKAASKALAAAGIPVDGDGAALLEISLVLADNAFIRELNRDYRGKDTPTNVLSFPALDARDIKRLRQPAATSAAPRDLPLGDIVLALETVESEAEAAGKSIKDHYYHLIVHGLLHLIGYDHIEDAEAAEMERLETAILASMGIIDPYEVKE